jgi:hypothetical protein
MKISQYGLVILVILVTSTPALVLAETENEANEGANELSGKQFQKAEAEHEGNKSMNSGDLILFVTIAAIAGIVGYSLWQAYKVKRRSTSKTMV